MTLTYAIEEGLGAAEFIDVLKRSGLDARRPVDKPDIIQGMVDNADLVVTVRDEDGKLVGIARSVTDFAYCCYLSDLAVDRACQRQGIGKELMRRTKIAAGGDKIALLLLSAPDGMDYYPRVGLEKLDNCFGVRRT
ncbi:MAG: GNAT family N-acetyltransferase [Alphaproteobacteria bacterium]|jgi:predicted N-acetyltransferase YhbS|nr:GNAT family N-acetyltransferase [Alphaproteobacteria bacterium]MBT7943333.1 GNAT family N-acetyltransferase [Alphaproteobacteria bacterium]